MTLISDSKTLAAFCQRQAAADYITVDTEFMRDRTYWPVLCLVQIAGPEEAAAIDTLAPNLDLKPLLALMANPKVTKVFHAARQDIEIFYHLSGKVPAPLVDTQVAAMVCGFGDAVSYETLAGRLANASIDKSSRFTDWAHRPLTERQLKYALDDVIHLRVIYEKLAKRLAKTGRTEWVREEMTTLTDPAAYRLEPREAWRRLKVRSEKPRLLAILRELAAWREEEAQKRDMPRNRVLKDESLLEIAAHAPKGVDELARTRGLSRSLAEGRQGSAILAAVRRAAELSEDELPRPRERQELPPSIGPVVELLRVLLKSKCEKHGVAQKLVASAGDLELIAADDDAQVPALHGWRRELFGADALALKHGQLALAISKNRVELVPLTGRRSASTDAA
jgi:ribonuclease D